MIARRMVGRLAPAMLVAVLLGAPFPPALLSAQAADDDLRGVWEAARRFGPDVRGPLVLFETTDGWRADIAGCSVPARWEGDAVTFELPDGKGSFRGRRGGPDALHGHWIDARGGVGLGKADRRT